jgi:hypothetical protein
MKSRIFFFLFSFLFFFGKVNEQCEMCRAVLESEESQSAAEGINDGIIFLMAVPYILVAAIGYFVYRKYGKSQTKKEIE